MNEKITITLTHYNRLDLLERTISSFLETNSLAFDEFLIYDDSGNPDITNILKTRYKDFTILGEEKSIGQRRALDMLFNVSKNEYIFHLEDDWFFDSNNQYMENSLKLLTNHPDVHQIWVRHSHDTPQKTVGDVQNFEGIEYYQLDPNFRNEWNGFSWNPGLRRKSDYLKFFPNGFYPIGDELKCSLHSRQFNYKVLQLKATACYHIGDISTNPHLT